MTTIRPLIHLVRTSHVHILRQLQLEEALLRADDRSVAIITEGSPPAIVMGVSGDADVLLHKGNVLQDGVDVVRRFSGGGTVPSHRLLPDDLDVLDCVDGQAPFVTRSLQVFVDGQTLFVTLLFNQSVVPSVPCYPGHVMNWTEVFYRSVFNRFQSSAADGRMVSLGSRFALRESDYVIDDRKFGGNAQYLSRDRWLHHTSFLWKCDTALFARYLTLPPKRPQYRVDRAHADFVRTLDTLVPSKRELVDAIVEELETLADVVPISMDELAHTYTHAISLRCICKWPPI